MWNYERCVFGGKRASRSYTHIEHVTKNRTFSTFQLLLLPPDRKLVFLTFSHLFCLFLCQLCFFNHAFQNVLLLLPAGQGGSKPRPRSQEKSSEDTRRKRGLWRTTITIENCVTAFSDPLLSGLVYRHLLASPKIFKYCSATNVHIEHYDSAIL